MESRFPRGELGKVVALDRAAVLRRPHSSLNDRTPQEAYTDGGTTRKPADEAA